MSERLGPMYRKAKEDVSSPDPDESCDFSSGYPTLFAFLTSSKYEGKKRTTGTIGLFWDEGKAKVRITDRDQGMNAFVSSNTFQEALEAAEKKMGSGDLDWRKHEDESKPTNTFRRR